MKSLHVDSTSRLVINLSLVGRRPTGIANYALNLVPALDIEQATLLLPDGVSFARGVAYPHRQHSVPSNLSPDDGKWGHLRRLLWTQRKLPKICRQLHSSYKGKTQRPLIFSPAPEAPLWAGCRAVVMVHDLIPLRFPNWRSPLTPYFRYYVPQVLQQSAHVLCNSLATADEVIQQFGISAQKITPIPLAYDASHFRPLDLPPQNYFLYIGRSDPHKNVPRLIEAFAALPRPHDFELWLVGSTDARYIPRLKLQAQALGVAKQVKWLDYVPYSDLPKILNQAIALIFPSLWEGFGLPVLEAMACGTPVVTSNLSALPEVAGDAAILVDPYRVEAIADAMHQVATQTATRSSLRQAGFYRVNQFSWANTGQQTADVLRRYL